MKSALALFSLAASVSAEAIGAACTTQAGCTTANTCCAYWKNNGATTETSKVTSTCQSAPLTDAAVLSVSGTGLAVQKETDGITIKTVPYLCMAAAFPCATDNSETEC